MVEHKVLSMAAQGSIAQDIIENIIRRARRRNIISYSPTQWKKTHCFNHAKAYLKKKPSLIISAVAKSHLLPTDPIPERVHQYFRNISKFRAENDSVPFITIGRYHTGLMDRKNLTQNLEEIVDLYQPDIAIAEVRYQEQQEFNTFILDKITDIFIEPEKYRNNPQIVATGTKRISTPGRICTTMHKQEYHGGSFRTVTTALMVPAEEYFTKKDVVKKTAHTHSSSAAHPIQY